ncbi:hypothetical protein [Streptomyces sp. NBC_00057]|uniref:hypothetical protein n=1 Tax=Streptomyces sp. NBC_00057 TaxID=2975634 RepID=UPI003243554F
MAAAVFRNRSGRVRLGDAQPLFEEARQAVRETRAHHMADNGPRVRIVDRCQALLDNRGLQSS